MTPKEKAQEIFDKYFDEMLSFGFYLHNSQIIRLSLIAVEEIIEATSIKYEFRDAELFYAGKKPMQYWLDVKTEIEAL